jgi:hypothetical protein
MTRWLVGPRSATRAIARTRLLLWGRGRRVRYGCGPDSALTKVSPLERRSYMGDSENIERLHKFFRVFASALAGKRDHAIERTVAFVIEVEQFGEGSEQLGLGERLL